MTFKEWYMRVEDGDDCSVHDCVWGGDYSKSRNVQSIIEQAFEAGYNACIDGLIEGNDNPEWVEIHKDDLKEMRYE